MRTYSAITGTSLRLAREHAAAQFASSPEVASVDMYVVAGARVVGGYAQQALVRIYADGPKAWKVLTEAEVRATLSADELAHAQRWINYYG